MLTGTHLEGRVPVRLPLPPEREEVSDDDTEAEDEDHRAQEETIQATGRERGQEASGWRTRGAHRYPGEVQPQE